MSDSDPDSERSDSDSERQTNADEWRELLSCITLRPSGTLGEAISDTVSGLVRGLQQRPGLAVEALVLFAKYDPTGAAEAQIVRLASEGGGIFVCGFG